jgi:hypothetical protein
MNDNRVSSFFKKWWPLILLVLGDVVAVYTASYALRIQNPMLYDLSGVALALFSGGIGAAWPIIYFDLTKSEEKCI